MPSAEQLAKQLADRAKQPQVAPDASAYPVRKEGLAEANLVTIGRTKTSDIMLESSAVSKLHAYFSRDPIAGTYTLADAGSRNGTFVSGKRLEKGEPVALAGGEEIDIAGRFKALYLTPSLLFSFVRSMDT